MQTQQRGTAGGSGRAGDERAPDVKSLQAICRRQAWAIETLARVIRDLRSGLAALRAENAELRGLADLGRLSSGHAGSGDWVEARLPLDARAPQAARIIVGQVLGERVAASVLERAKLVISELVSNSVRHSGLPAAAGVAVRVRMVRGGFRLEVEDPGRTGAVALPEIDPAALGGFGLRIVQSLSQRWGSERGEHGGTRVWAHLCDTAGSAGRDFGEAGQAVLPPVEPVGGTGRTPTRHREAAVAAIGSTTVHVVPRPRASTWCVYGDAAAGPLSEHTSETAAEAAARAHARSTGAGEIVVHDRYHRTHAGCLTPGGE